ARTGSPLGVRASELWRKVGLVVALEGSTTTQSNVRDDAGAASAHSALRIIATPAGHRARRPRPREPGVQDSATAAVHPSRRAGRAKVLRLRAPIRDSAARRRGECGRKRMIDPPVL